MKLWKIGVLGIAAALFLNGCGKDCKDKIINPSMEDITAVSEVETTKNFIKNTYTGIDIRNKGEITNETGDVSRIGMNMYQSRINDKDFYFNDVAVRDGKMIVAYSLVTRVYNEGEKENNHNYGMDIYEIHIAVINIKNKEIIKDFVPGKEFLNVVFDRGGFIYVLRTAMVVRKAHIMITALINYLILNAITIIRVIFPKTAAEYITLKEIKYVCITRRMAQSAM